MNVSPNTVAAPEDRLQRYRRIAARLDPTRDPAHAFAEGLYVARPNSVGSRLAAALELRPASVHLLVGGVGSGKTTELHVVRDRLDKVGDTLTLYLDVSRKHDIAKLVPGVLAIQVGLALGAWLVGVSGEKSKELDKLREIAFPHRADVHELIADEFENQDTVTIPGLLSSSTDVDGELPRILKLTSAVRVAVGQHKPHVVVLLDGLDRLADMVLLQQAIDKDVAALHAMNIGVVLTAPLRSLYGIDRTIEDRVDQLHYLPWVDAGGSEETLLADVLNRRLSEDMAEGPALQLLARASGGVLRDLIALAQLASSEAYLAGADAIREVDVQVAMDAFGRKHMQGLDREELDALVRVLTTKSFVHTSERDLGLLMTRRVLEYRVAGIPRYAVHPTIVDFVLTFAHGKKK